jgi:hypothetical protein
MAKNPGGSKIVNAVRETLDSVVTPSVRDTILARALAAASRTELPTEPRELDDFLHGALQDTLVKALGPELGLSVSSELERITATARKASGPHEAVREQHDTVRPGARTRSISVPNQRKARSTLPSPEMKRDGGASASEPRRSEKTRRAIAPTVPAGRRVQVAEPSPSRVAREQSIHAKGAPLPMSADYPRGVAKALGVIGTASVDPGPTRRPLVLLASTDPELVRLFTAWLDLRAAVEETAGAKQLVMRLAELEGKRAVIVLDGKHPGVRPLTLAALADELPAGTIVILWGVQPHLHARMCTISALAEKWTVYGGDATSNEVVAECAKMFG